MNQTEKKLKDEIRRAELIQKVKREQAEIDKKREK